MADWRPLTKEDLDRVFRELDAFMEEVRAEHKDVFDKHDALADCCPKCGNEYVKQVNLSPDIFAWGEVVWALYCEEDDNLSSRGIKFCPYCGTKLPEWVDDTQNP